MEAMRILLADDHILFRQGLASLILPRRDLEVVGEAKDGIEAINLAREIRPDVILMDVHMPKLDGLETLKVLKREMPDVAVVMLTASDDDDILFQAIKNGAEGYLLKSLEPPELYRMLDRLRRGEAAISGAMASKILREFTTPPSNKTKQQRKADKLTVREIEVLEELVKGSDNREIADRLTIAENTVRVHIRNILEKLHVHKRIQAAVHAVREGLINDSSHPSE